MKGKKFDLTVWLWGVILSVKKKSNLCFTSILTMVQLCKSSCVQSNYYLHHQHGPVAVQEGVAWTLD